MMKIPRKSGLRRALMMSGSGVLVIDKDGKWEVKGRHVYIDTEVAAIVKDLPIKNIDEFIIWAEGYDFTPPHPPKGGTATPPVCVDEVTRLTLEQVDWITERIKKGEQTC